MPNYVINLDLEIFQIEECDKIEKLVRDLDGQTLQNAIKRDASILCQ